MKPALKIITSLLLLFDGTGAIYGGWNLMLHPDGSSLQMTTHYLQYSPFNNYFIPGIILFTANGLFSFFVLVALLFNYQSSPSLVIGQGVILTGWIVIQILMVQMIYYLHFVLGTTGIALILCGWILYRNSRILKL